MTFLARNLDTVYESNARRSPVRELLAVIVVTCRTDSVSESCSVQACVIHPKSMQPVRLTKLDDPGGRIRVFLERAQLELSEARRVTNGSVG
jgi:hypothetical protein